MKKLLAILTFAFATSALAADDNWQTSEHNFNIKHGDWGLQVRTYNNDDYDHIEGSYKLSDSLTVALRYAEDGVNTEIRPKITHKIAKWGPLSLGQRLEYRYYEGTKDDYFRYRAIVGLKAGSAWIKMQPRWKFGAGQTGDTKIDDVKWQAGYDFTLDKDEDSSVKFTPYVEYLTAGQDSSWEKEHLILGTNFTVKF